MKVIVTGATGIAGRAIVQQCLQDEHITAVVILTRRAVPIDIESHPKAQVVMHHNFSHYPAEMMRGLEGAEACLWAIGGIKNKKKMKKRKVFFRDKDNNKGRDQDQDQNQDQDEDQDQDQNRNQNDVEYAVAAAGAMLRFLAHKTPNGKKFRFVFCESSSSSSAICADGAPGRLPLLFLLLFQHHHRRRRGPSRRIREEAEKELCRLADSNKDKLDVWILRPGGFIPSESSVPSKLVGMFGGAIATAQLGRAVVRVGCQGWGERIIENAALLKM